MSAKSAAITWCGLVSACLIVSLILADGHPRSNWIYPFIFALGAWGAVGILRRGDRPRGAGDAIPKSVANALASSALILVGAIALMYVYWNLLWTDNFTWGASVVVGGMAAVNNYRQKRGYPYSMWPSAVVFLVVMAAVIIMKLIGIIPPHRG